MKHCPRLGRRAEHRERQSLKMVDALKGWYDFYIAIGTASVTLLGAMFVVVSIGSGYLTQEKAKDVHLFLTPTVIHMASVMAGCALVLVPTLSWTSMGIALGLGSFCGLIYSIRVGTLVGRKQLELSDRFWYAGVPIVAYGVMMAAAFKAYAGSPASLELLPYALALLLAAGIRNAWDNLIFIVAQSKGPS
jgi:hypothetical protein